MRFQAECGHIAEEPRTAFQICEFIVNNRENSEYEGGKGHKRAAYMSMLALCVAACEAKGCRDISSEMKEMIPNSFPENWRTQFIYCLQHGCNKNAFGESNKASTQEVSYKKNGKDQMVVVPTRILSVKLMKWAQVQWPSVASKTDSKSKKRVRR